jgi:hypothetical protein
LLGPPPLILGLSRIGFPGVYLNRPLPRSFSHFYKTGEEDKDEGTSTEVTKNLPRKVALSGVLSIAEYFLDI